MYYIVYCTTNLVNGKQYVGIHQTDNLDDGYLGSGTLIREKIIKYGFDNFKRKILFFCENRIDALWLESLIISDWVIKKWGYGKHFYNKARGGLRSHRKKRAVKSLDMYGQIRYYKSITDTGKKHGCIVTGIKKQNVRYDKLWKYEENNTPWVWPSWIMQFGKCRIKETINYKEKENKKIERIKRKSKCIKVKTDLELKLEKEKKIWTERVELFIRLHCNN